MGRSKEFFLEAQMEAASERYGGVDMELENIRFGIDNAKRIAAAKHDIDIMPYLNLAERHLDNIETMKPEKKTTKRDIVLDKYPSAEARKIGSKCYVVVDGTTIGSGNDHAEAWSDAFKNLPS